MLSMKATSNSTVGNFVQLDKLNISLLEDGIVHNYIKFGEMIEAQDVHNIRDCNLNLVNFKPYGVLVESDELTSFSKEARDLAASKEIDCRSAAKALLIKSLGQRIIANFYLKFNKPFIPTRVFENKSEACDWLREEVEKEKLIKGLSI